MPCRKAASESVGRLTDIRVGEGGYTLLALLMLMALMMLFMSAAAPGIKHHRQRERELEAIRRGEEMAEAIRLFMHYHGGSLPTSISQLLEGVPRGSKRLQILRPSAARDPLTTSGEWQLVGVGDARLLEFARAVTVYAGGRTPITTDSLLEAYHQRVLTLINTNLSTDVNEATISQAPDTGPFIGVVSKSTSAAILHYYGIERHDKWVFTPLFR
jgi:type II secretory pathway pseudopilin PulG